MFKLGVRADFDISSNFKSDEIWFYEHVGEGETDWVEWDLREDSVYCAPPVDENEQYSKLAQTENGNTLFEDKTIAMTPSDNPAFEDTIYVLVSELSGEYDGHPDDYMDEGEFSNEDICFWDLPYHIVEPSGDTITINYWLYPP